ncbi:MAG: ribonuclease E/G [Alphaproteobacteria bacterium]|nr:ribonuclease E/G [Alphaproteobacteria bacterium]
MSADTILVDRVPGETRVAALAGATLVDLHIARGDPRFAVGAIHLGRVAQLVQGFDGAFVDIGMEQAAFLRAGDAPAPPRAGDPLVVQIVRATIGDKGLGVTARPRLAGRLLDWTPARPGVRTPRGMPPPAGLALAADEGVDVRAAAAGAPDAAIAAEADALRTEWRRVLAAARGAVAPAALAPGPDPWLGLVLHHGASLVAVRFADRATFVAARAAAERRLPGLADRFALDAEGWRLFEMAGVEEQIAAALRRRVPLPTGGSLTIDEAEALTVVDVDAEGSRANPAAINRAAVPAVAAALRLRGIGGQILVDFVREGGTKSRDATIAAVREAVSGDPEPVEIAGWSRLGLLEMTRRRARPSLAALLTTPREDQPAAARARAYDALRAGARAAAGAGVTRIVVAAGAAVAAELTGALAGDLAVLGEATSVAIGVVPDSTLGATDFRVAPAHPGGSQR